MLTVASLPLILGPSHLLIGVKSLQHYDPPGARSTALHFLTLGFWRAGATPLWATQFWLLGADLVLNEWSSLFHSHSVVPDY